MGGRIAALALGRRSRWVVIGVWLALAVALAPLQPKLQTIASDESETFFTRGADSTEVDRLLDTRFPEGGDSTAVIAYESVEGSIYTRTPERIEASSVAPLALEHGQWRGVTLSGRELAAGSYTAKWRKLGADWVIEAEIYLTLA